MTDLLAASLIDNVCMTQHHTTDRAHSKRQHTGEITKRICDFLNTLFAKRTSNHSLSHNHIHTTSPRTPSASLKLLQLRL